MGYRRLNQYLQDRFGEKVYKLALPGGTTCPTRDGTLDTRGCIFCSARGSGNFVPVNTISITEQIEIAKGIVKKKFKGTKYIAYFQSFTATYGELSAMEKRFFEAAAHPDIVAVSIATRPDCLPPEVLKMLSELNAVKPVFVELGLQTIHSGTAKYIRRGFPLAVFDEAAAALSKIGIHTVVHMIIGLPGESPEDIYATASYIGHSGADGIKLQLLHVLRGTDLAKDYAAGEFEVLSLEAYIEILGRCVELLPPDMVIHRLTGDGDKRELIAPLWSADKRRVQNEIQKMFREKHIEQGRLFVP